MSILTEIYDEVSEAQHHGNYLSMVCPWHDSYPVRHSLMVYEDWFRCLSCGKQGKPEYLLRYLQGGNGIIHSTQTFKNPWNSWLRNSTIKEICRRAYRLANEHPSQQAYWKSRGLTKKAIKKLELGWLDGWNIIPVRNRKGKIIGGVARASDTLNSPAKYATPSNYHQDTSKLLYVPSWKRLERSGAIYLAYGVISSMAIYLCGKASCSSLTGKKVNPEILQDIRKPIIIVPDKYEEQAAYKLANELGWRGSVLLLPYHDEILDPADMWLYKKETLKGLLNEQGHTSEL